MAVAVRVPLEQLADPTDTTYIPRPEWYFLFLFQTLKLFDGPLEVVGSVVLPGLAVLALILVPFIDRGKMVRVTRRTWRWLCGAGGHRLDRADGGGRDDARRASAGGRRWITRRRRIGCSSRPRRWPAWPTSARRTASSCHAIGEGGRTGSGPDPQTSIHRDAAWMIRHFKQPGRSASGHVHARRSRSAMRS